MSLNVSLICDTLWQALNTNRSILVEKAHSPIQGQAAGLSCIYMHVYYTTAK